MREIDSSAVHPSSAIPKAEINKKKWRRHG